jgi:hypothetical protein
MLSLIKFFPDFPDGRSSTIDAGGQVQGHSRQATEHLHSVFGHKHTPAYDSTSSKFHLERCPQVRARLFQFQQLEKGLDGTTAVTIR